MDKLENNIKFRISCPTLWLALFVNGTITVACFGIPSICLISFYSSSSFLANTIPGPNSHCSGGKSLHSSLVSFISSSSVAKKVHETPQIIDVVYPGNRISFLRNHWSSFSSLTRSILSLLLIPRISFPNGIIIAVSHDVTNLNCHPGHFDGNDKIGNSALKYCNY